MAGGGLAGKRILLVEDETLVAMLAEDILAEAGCAVEVAGDLHSARRAIESARFDAAVLDLNLRGEDAYPLAPLLQARGVPFLFASGYGGPLRPEIERHPLVAKPYREDELLDRLAALIAGA